NLLKRVVARPRPKLFCRSRRRSFPSGHSAASSAYFLGLAAMAPRRFRALALAGGFLGIALVDWLRVRARAHWPSDVLAGDVLGALSVVGAQHMAGRDIGGVSVAR